MKQKMPTVILFAEKIALLATVLAGVVGVGIFLYINNELFTHFGVMVFAYALMVVLMVVGFVLCLVKEQENNRKTKTLNFVTALVTVLIGIYIILTELIFDYFQPLSLFTPPIICFAVFLFAYALGTILGVFTRRNSAAVSLIGVAALGIFLITAGWSGLQGYATFNPDVESVVVFAKGESGYETCRIPSLLVIEDGKMAGENNSDVLVAFAEGRRNTSLDNGISDLVYKTSTDAGKTWSKLAVLLTAEDLLGSEGRIADPTPVYDKNTDTIGLIFQASTKESRYKMSPFYLQGKPSADGSIVWNKASAQNLAETSGLSFAPGPSKGTQLEDGTLAFPIRSKGFGYVLYTSDAGATWAKGETAGTGGESDMTLLGKDELVMIIREGKMSDFPRNNHLRFAFSSDNGRTWERQAAVSTLRTPVVMSSVASNNGVLYCAHADSYLTRANLSYSISKDRGESWQTFSLYSGASGYAVSDITANGDYYIIAEIGKVEYNEEVRLFHIPLPKSIL